MKGELEERRRRRRGEERRRRGERRGARGGYNVELNRGFFLLLLLPAASN